MKLLRPDWPVPAGIGAAATTRCGGASAGPWAGLNLATHVGDELSAVLANRSRITRALGLPRAPRWLDQVHGTRVVVAESAQPDLRADAVVSSTPGHPCAVLTADCLPVLFAAADGRHVGAAHAGWRGLVGGVLEATAGALRAAGAGELIAWLGPAISAGAYEVDARVRDAFLDRDPAAEAAFLPVRPGHWQLDLEAAARQRLDRLGVRRVHGGGLCTFGLPKQFYSFRRDGRCGRQATLVWIKP
ncbi:MAG: peptidoglycan editing factor PgeF [Chromatiales bacterium]|nr:peptidoglycan editing factor PgeF [Chromatiales bacterium]